MQDLSYIQQREDKARRLLIVVSVILAIVVFGLPMVAARHARHHRSLELRRLLRGGGRKNPEFQPILSNLCELMDRMASEQQEMPEQWTAENWRGCCDK